MYLIILNYLNIKDRFYYFFILERIDDPIESTDVGTNNLARAIDTPQQNRVRQSTISGYFQQPIDVNRQKLIDNQLTKMIVKG